MVQRDRIVVRPIPWLCAIICCIARLIPARKVINIMMSLFNFSSFEIRKRTIIINGLLIIVCKIIKYTIKIGLDLLKEHSNKHMSWKLSTVQT